MMAKVRRVEQVGFIATNKCEREKKKEKMSEKIQVRSFVVMS